jgi:RimJ/RimL family protein N-acetyltransferase
MRLIAISVTGEPAQTVPGLPEFAVSIGQAYRKLYQAAGFASPWLGYFALEDDVCVGTCGFKGPPVNNRVEIAYFTFPEHEGRGCATRMARALLRIVRETDAEVIATAQTLPREGASTAILQKLGFVLIGSLNHPEDGEVWEWQVAGLAPQA